MSNTFLKADWKKLVMANYSVDKSILTKYLPPNTEIDLFNGTCFISLVGFMFLNTRILGIKIPFHTNFEEVNLRFYVRFKENNEWKRGVVFIKEIVPKSAITFVANTVYKENYETALMKHSWEEIDDTLKVMYSWKKDNHWNSLQITTNQKPSLDLNKNQAEFITEHYWGYTKISDTKTAEYGVEHPKWEIYQTIDHFIDVDFGTAYGMNFKFLNKANPDSVILAEGSTIMVKNGKIV